jgi:hypothetical protein
MKSRYVTFIIRIRFDESGDGPPGNSCVQGNLQQAGASQVQPFDNFDRLVDLLRQAIAGAEPEDPDTPRITNMVIGDFYNGLPRP